MGQLEIDQLKQIAKDALSFAKEQGAYHAEVGVTISKGYGVTVRMGIPEEVEYQQDKDVAVTVYFDHRKGSATTTNEKEQSLKETVNKACSIAQFTEEDPCAGLADADLMAKNILDLDLYHPCGVSVDEAIQLALQCENEARSLDKRIVNSEGASFASYDAFYVYANSHGFMGSEFGTKHNISCALVAESNGLMERDYSYSVARDFSNLKGIKTIAQETVDRTISRLNPRKLSTCKVPVIFTAEIARGLIGRFVKAINGYSLYKKSSFLIDHLGKPVFSKQIRIYERPHLLKGLGSSAFDAEGVATYDKDFVKEGILQSYVLDHYSACQLGTQTTGNAGGVHNLFVESSDMDLSLLLKKMDTGILITELIGHGINLVTGDYSRGAFGFWVENGEIQYPVSEITIAGNLKDMFLNLVAVGNDIDTRGNVQTGSILLEEMMVAGS